MAFFIIQLFLLPFSIPVLNDDIPGLVWLPSSATASRCSASSAMAMDPPRFKGADAIVAAHGLNLLSRCGRPGLTRPCLLHGGWCVHRHLPGQRLEAAPPGVTACRSGSGSQAQASAAALVGIFVSPVAVKLRGLYLAIVTLGLVFLGIHLGNTSWGAKIRRSTGPRPEGAGSRHPPLEGRGSARQHVATTAAGCGSTSPKAQEATSSSW